MPARGHPAVGVHAPIAQHLEILMGPPARRLRIRRVERIGEAGPLDRPLDVAVDDCRLGDAHDLHQRRHEVDAVVELGANLAVILDAARPRDDHAVAGAAEMRRDLLRPLKRRIARPGPSDRVMGRRAGQAPFVHEAHGLLDRRLQPVEAHDLVRRADQRAFRARTVVAHDVDDKRVVEFIELFDRIDDASDFMVRVFEKIGVVLRLAGEELAMLFRLAVP